MAFDLAMYPVSYLAEYDASLNKWHETWIEADDVEYNQLLKQSERVKSDVYTKRNRFPLPLVNYSTQYGFSCFEGMKAFPHKDSRISIFRPDCNAKRFADSMRGLYAPPFPEDLFVQASLECIRRNEKLGYIPSYKEEWEKDNFASANAVYMRPFMYAEGGIGVSISKSPSVVICATTVSSYFNGKNTKAITTNRVRATPHGTGNIKCASNYVISALAKKEAEDAGFMEVIFLDACEQKYIEEGSSCNIFFYLKDGSLVTPELGDTILPGITRSSVIDLARKMNVSVFERKIMIEEVFNEAQACFVTGTAAGITPIESVTHKGKEVIFKNQNSTMLGTALQKNLKGIQYGILDDVFAWNRFI